MKLWSKLRSLFGKGKLDAEMAEEMRLHLELQTEKYLAAGMNAEEARHAARREFGGLEQIKEQCREQRGWVWLEMLNRDLMFTARRLRRTPAFTVTALMTL